MQVLLVRAGALGDLLLLRRATSALRSAGHRVLLLAPAAGVVLVGGGASEVDGLLPWDGPEVARILSGEGADGPVADALREADAVVAYTRDGDVLAALRTRTRQLVGFDPAPPVAGPHASEWLTRPLAELGVTAAGEPPDLRFSPAETAAAAPLLASLPPGFVAVHPGSGSPRKNWPAPRFLELARRLAGPHPWLLVSGPAEEQLVLEAAGAVVAPSLPPRVLGALLSRAGLFVGNDAGVTHLAAAAGAPTLALFGPTSPALWSPVGRRVRCLAARDGALDALTVDEVAAAARVSAGNTYINR